MLIMVRSDEERWTGSEVIANAHAVYSPILYSLLAPLLQVLFTSPGLQQTLNYVDLWTTGTTTTKEMIMEEQLGSGTGLQLT